MQVREAHIGLNSGWQRLGLLLLLAAALVWAWFQLSAQVRAVQMANVADEADSLKTALGYDPGQAEAHSQLGFYYLFDPFLYDPSQAVQQFEAAARIHPFDWNAWTNLGAAYEQQGEVTKAERAYLTGVKLAPHYFYPRWDYGNFLLRQGEMRSAFDQFRRVAEIRPRAIPNICDLIWQTTGGEAEALVRFGAGLRSGVSKGEICQCLVARAQYRPALELWKTVAETDPAKIVTGRSLVAWLGRARQWSLAHRVWQEVLRERFKGNGGLSPADVAFWNGDFEYDAAVGGFQWSIQSSPMVAASLDTLEHYRGARSLLLEFRQHQRVNFAGVAHDLFVQPSTRYLLRFYYKTEEMPEASGLAVVVSDAEAASRFQVQSEPLDSQPHWTRREIVFETPEATRILRLQIVRRPTQRLYDYIKGKVWFDSFALEPAPTGDVSQSAPPSNESR